MLAQPRVPCAGDRDSDADRAGVICAFAPRIKARLSVPNRQYADAVLTLGEPVVNELRAGRKRIEGSERGDAFGCDLERILAADDAAGAVELADRVGATQRVRISASP